MTKNIKLAMHTADLSDEKFLALQDLFPEVVTETITTDENGASVVTRAIDADVLQQLINKNVVSGKEERYQFTWPDKKKAMLLANAPINKTLRPCREESVDFDNTENLYIEGDNLDVLKLLRETYLGKIKMIYIDPPYNTGNDFVYEDDFAEDTQDFLKRDNQIDEQGNRLVTNTESNGRFHTDWLNMMYPRLRVARDLLSEDGVIFISLDDNESTNMTKICDEILGEKNRIALICHKARASVSNDKIISPNHNTILFYARNIDEIHINRKMIGLDPDLSGFNYDDNDGKDSYRLVPVDGPGGARKGNPYYEFLGIEGYFRFSKETMEQKYKENLVVKKGNSLYQKYYKNTAAQTRKTDTTWWEDGGLTSSATSKLKELMGGSYFNNPKPIELIYRMLKLITFDYKDSIILDFFSGSSTTAHAVMQLNAEDEGNRKFIMVQLLEKTDENSEAFKAGYKNICEIGEERIRRAGKKIKDEIGLTALHLDTGFRVLKLDESNMNSVFYSPDEYKEANFKFEDLIENIKADRTHEDILFQVMLELGVPLSAKIKTDGNIITVDGNYLVACFDKVDSETVIQIAKMQPYYVVFRDSSFMNDSSLVNVDQIFNTYSPTTKLRVL